MECMKCKAQMFNATLVGDTMGAASVFLRNKKKGIFESEKRCKVECFVCPSCGYVELKAENPKSIMLD
ncbi:MAG: hypothetical protein IKZ30_05170 [Oscillospiraceae bacterium]|nr:hypothetical protein [Oscillospiraceae bacterium]